MLSEVDFSGIFKEILHHSDPPRVMWCELRMLYFNPGVTGAGALAVLEQSISQKTSFSFCHEFSMIVWMGADGWRGVQKGGVEGA